MKNHNTLISLANSVTKRMFGGLLAAGMMLAASSPALAGGNHIGSNIQVLPRTTPSGIPVSNGLLGDSNPYGVQFVPQNFMGGHGMLQTNDVLVSNYNNTTVQLGNTVSTQGLGTTITRIRPDGQGSVFFNSTEMGVTGFTNALDILPRGLIFARVANTTCIRPARSASTRFRIRTSSAHIAGRILFRRCRERALRVRSCLAKALPKVASA